jgi:hypothetical protein
MALEATQPTVGGRRAPLYARPVADIERDSDVQDRRTEPDAVANLRIVLELCAAGQLRCSAKTQRPTAASVGGLAAVLASGDFYRYEPIAAYAWPLLVQAGGLAELAGSRLQLTARGRAALAAPAATTIRDLWRRWILGAVIDELSRVEAIKGQRAASALSSPTIRRQVVATALASCPAGEWIEVDELFGRMRRDRLNPAVARSERGLWRLYLVDPDYGSLGHAGHHQWTLLEGRYTLAVIFEYAATLGLVDVAYRDPAGAREDFRGNWGADELYYLSRYDGLDSIRLTSLGAYALGLTDQHTPTPTTDAAVKVLPNHDIVALADLPLGDRMTLSSFAEQTSERVWQLSMAGLLTAAGNGRHPDELLDFLNRTADHALPETVSTLISDAAARTSALIDRGMVRLVECSDATVATLLANDRALSRLCQRIGDRHLAIDAEHEATFRKALTRLGYALPARPRG